MKSSGDTKKPKYSLISNIGYLYSLHWRYCKASFILLIIGIPISLGLSFFGVYMPKVVVEQVINDQPFAIAIIPVLFIGVVVLLLNLSDQIITTINFALLSKFKNSIINIKAEKCLSSDYENIESPKFRYLMQRTDEALWGSNSGSAVEQMSRESIALLTSILGYIMLGTILTIANPLLIIVLTVAPIINYYVVKAIQQYQHASKDYTVPLDKKLWYIAATADSYEAAKDIRIYGLNKWLLNMYKNLAKERLRWDMKTSYKYFYSTIIDGLIILIRDSVAYIMLIVMYINNKITIDNFILYFSAVGSFTGMVGSIISRFITINSISLTTCDLREFLAYPEKSNHMETLPHIKSVISERVGVQLQNICYTYPNATNESISDVTFAIAAGEKLAIVGLNGAGKTTLVKMICGLYTPTKGDILINGVNAKNVNIYDYYSLFSVVFQDQNFLAVSIAETVSCKKPEFTDVKRVIKCLEEAGLYDKIATLEDGIESMLNRQIHENAIDLSGGEYQKLLLARALYKNSPILILDEPTAAYDPIAESEFYLKYNSLFRDKTSIFISHRLSSTKFCDRILLLQEGRIIEVGTHVELINMGGEYARLFDMQRQYYTDTENVKYA